MKRFIIALIIIVVAAMIFPYLSVLAQPTHTPHQNPVTAADSSDMISLLLFYNSAFDLATLRQYRDAQNILAELEHANIPDELRYLTDRYHDLCQQLFAAMNNLEFLLDKTSALFSSTGLVRLTKRLLRRKRPFRISPPCWKIRKRPPTL